MPTATTSKDTRPPIHASNAWNPTGLNLLPVPRCRLYYAHGEALSGPRTFVFLGSQQRLTFVADIEGHVAPEDLRDAAMRASRLYPHQVDLEPAAGLPQVTHGERRRGTV